jgi:5-oxoprolinase (ATP-hydrolysing) subunit A
VARTVDLNCDLGEGLGPWGLGTDPALLEVVTSANVACGFHAGDPSIMGQVCAVAARRGVAVGAHVSYPDREGFGRRFMEMDPIDLADAVVDQIGALDAIAQTTGTRVTYVKPHGALYHAVIDQAAQAVAVATAVAAVGGDLTVVCAPGSFLANEARNRAVNVVHEAFVDRAYLPDGRLVPRSRGGSVVVSADEAARRAVQIVIHKGLHSIDGMWVPLDVQSLCVHSDTPNAPLIAHAVHAALVATGVRLAAFAPP